MRAVAKLNSWLLCIRKILTVCPMNAVKNCAIKTFFKGSLGSTLVKSIGYFLGRYVAQERLWYEEKKCTSYYVLDLGIERGELDLGLKLQFTYE
jgi:hypothetical protein